MIPPAATGDDFSPFAQTILNQKYAMARGDRKETWAEVAYRQAEHVARPLDADLADRIEVWIRNRQFLPAGRYLYGAGRPFHAVLNCGLLRAHDSRQGWGSLADRHANMLMTGMGIGTVYTDVRPYGELVGGMGGIATGPCSLMQMMNELGRHIQQGGARRAALWGGLHWYHKDVKKFVSLKDWPKWLREQKEINFDTPAPMDGTNISVIADQWMVDAVRDPNHPDHAVANDVYWDVVRHMCETAEPGFSFDPPGRERESLRNAPVSADTNVLVRSSSDPGGEYVRVGDIVGKEVLVWTRYDWVPATFTKTRENAPTVRVEMSNGRHIVCTPDHEFILPLGERVPAGELTPGTALMVNTPYGVCQGVDVVSVAPDAPQDVFCCDVKVAEHSFMAEGVIVSNCTEVTSEDDNDICDLGSMNMARFATIGDFAKGVWDATAFLLMGTVYTDLPNDLTRQVMEKNRRIGLGLMGLHEWLLRRGKAYGPDSELGDWLAVYAEESDRASTYWSKKLGVNYPSGRRSVAPTGTIAIVAETTSGIEPIFAAAFKRRYLKGSRWHYQYVVDATAQRLIEAGVKPEAIEDAYDLSADVERRLAFQAFVQGFVPMSISSCLMAGSSAVLTDGGLFDVAELAGGAEMGKFTPAAEAVASYNIDGRRATITEGYNNGVAKTVRLRCEKGYELTCTPNHKVVVLDSDYKLQWREAGAVEVGDVLVGRKGLDLWNGRSSQVPLAELVGSEFVPAQRANSKEFRVPNRMTSPLARLIGYLCSDGSVGINGISLCQRENNVCDDFERLVDELFGLTVTRVADNRSEGLFNLIVNCRDLAEFFRWLGLTNHDEQTVPLAIRRSGRTFVKQFLRGVTLDGYVSDQHVCPLTSVSRRYVDQIHQLLLNFGIDPCLTVNPAGERMFPSGKTYKTKESYALVCSGVDGNRFIERIGFAEDAKVELSAEWSRVGTRSRSGVVPDFGLRKRFREEILPKLRSRKFYMHFSSMTDAAQIGYGLPKQLLLEMGDLGFDYPAFLSDDTYAFRPVTAVEEGPETQTYDLSVPDGNSYIANGLICHNTINMPAWGSDLNNETTVQKFGETLLNYLPRLRGVTSYPDGARGGQPLTKVSYHEAVKHRGVEFAEFGNERACVNGVCGV